MSLNLPRGYFWEFSLPGDPLPGLLAKPMPIGAVLGFHSDGVVHVVRDGRKQIIDEAAGLLVRRAQQQLIGLFGILDPRVHGIISDLGEEPTMMLIVEGVTGRTTVMPRSLAVAFLAKTNLGTVLAVKAVGKKGK